MDPNAGGKVQPTVAGRIENEANLKRSVDLKELMARIDVKWDNGFIDKDTYLEKRNEIQRELESLRPVDFDELTNAGSMMGSGGLIVMDDDSCMVDTTRFYINFLAHESCGQCVPCREGLRQLLVILDNIVMGKGRPGDLDLIEELCDVLSDASMCALGTSAANPVRSALQHFRSEFEAHVNEKRCPALVCKELIHYAIGAEKCEGCMICVRECPTTAIAGGKRLTHTIDYSKCFKCGNCLTACPTKFGAITKAPGPFPKGHEPAKPVTT
jgi:NAD-dependent dihydropyrimidine dehydrogenase PreA subunit